jgi:hypothetical protein
MTQSSSTSRWAYTADGSTHAYSFTTKIFATSEIKVYVDGTLKTLTTHYTVSLNGNNGGTVTITDGSDTAGKVVVLSRNVANNQLSDYVEGDQFPANTIEDDFDRRTIVAMQVADQILRSLRAPETDPVDTDMVLPAKASRLGKLLRFNSTTGLPEVVAAVDVDLNVVPDIWDTVLAAATLAAIRTALGLAIGSDVQAYNANLAALAGLSLVADRLPYANGIGTLALATLTAAGRALLDDADATAQIATLGILTTEDLTLAGGARITPKSITWTSFTVDPGDRPIQYGTNSGAITITAPANDGSCLLFVTNDGSAGSITFSGFTVGASTGDSLTTTNGSKFSIFIWRANGTAAYSIFAHQ